MDRIATGSALGAFSANAQEAPHLAANDALIAQASHLTPWGFRAVMPTDTPAMEAVLNGVHALKISNAKKAVCTELVHDVCFGMQEQNMIWAPAAMEIMAEIMQAGPARKLVRMDQNATYVHQFSQAYFRLWEIQHREEILHHVVRLRTGIAPEHVDPKLVAKWRAELDEELSPELNDIHMALAFLHDLVEDYARYGVTIEMLKDELAKRTGYPIETYAIQMIGDSVDDMSRRINDDGQKEPTQFFSRRAATRSQRSALAKMGDVLQNNSSEFRSGKDDDALWNTLYKRRFFLQCVKDRWHCRSILLDYRSSYAYEQLSLTAQHLNTDLKDQCKRASLEESLNLVRKVYDKGGVPIAIHPMMSIVQRIQEDLYDVDGVFNRNPLGRASNPVPEPFLPFASGLSRLAKPSLSA